MRNIIVIILMLMFVSLAGFSQTDLNGRIAPRMIYPIDTADASLNKPQWEAYIQSFLTPQIYPTAGIALSTGTGWGASITNNSVNWNNTVDSIPILRANINANLDSINVFRPLIDANTLKVTNTDDQQLSIDSVARIFTISIESGNSVKFEDTNTTYDLSQYQQDSDTSAFDGTKYDDRFGNTAYGWGNHAGLYRPIAYVPSWSEITSKPTTLSGFGITDAQSFITAGTTAQYWRGDKTWQTLNSSIVPELTNLYYTEARVTANASVADNTTKVTNATHTGDVTGATALTIANDVVTFPKMQNITANKLIGSGLTGTEIAEITLGTNLSFTGDTLNVASSPYPGVGIPLSTGSAWGTSITNNSGLWNDSHNAMITSGVLSQNSTSLILNLSRFGLTDLSFSVSKTWASGSSTQVQYNNGGYFGASSSFTFNSTTGAVTATNFILGSDRRLKKNINPIQNLSKFDDIEFVQFNMKSNTNQIRIGVIAQEVEKIAPELVRIDDKGMYSVAYIDLLIAKVARQDEIINSLINRIEKLEDEK